MGGSQGSPDWRSQGPWPREDGAHMGGCFCIPGERSLPWGPGEFPGGGGGVWPGALSRSADPGKLVFWSTCPSKDGEMTVLSGCLSSPSRLVFPFWVQNGGEVRGKQLLYLRSGLCAGPVLCGWGVRAAPGSHS